MTELSIISTLDGAKEKALFFFPNGRTDVPMVVGLHTWSYNRFNQIEQMLPYCRGNPVTLSMNRVKTGNFAASPERTACTKAVLFVPGKPQTLTEQAFF